MKLILSNIKFIMILISTLKIQTLIRISKIPALNYKLRNSIKISKKLENIYEYKLKIFFFFKI